MRHPSHSELQHPSQSLAYSVRPLPRRTLHYPCPHATCTAHKVLRAVDESSGFSLAGRGGLHARAGVALGPFDVARSSERTDEHERFMHGNGAEGRSQGSRAEAGARSGTLYSAFSKNGTH